MDFDDFNENGWNMLHEVAYKGDTKKIEELLELASTNPRSHNIIEAKTIDEFKTTPIILAALGGHLDAVKFLYEKGANINEKLEFRNNLKHTIVEVAAIRQDVELLIYLYDKTPNIGKRLRDLMVAEILDDESRSTFGRLLEDLTNDYSDIISKLYRFKISTHADRLTTLFKPRQLIVYDLVNSETFGACLANFFRLSSESDDSISSAVIVLLNTAIDPNVRKKFFESKGISFLVKYMEDHKDLLNQKYEYYNKLYKLVLKTTRNQPNLSKDSKNAPSLTSLLATAMANSDDIIHLDENEKRQIERKDSFVKCASVGQALAVLSKYNDFLTIINKDGVNEKVISYVRLLFLWNNLNRVLNIKELTNTKKITFNRGVKKHNDVDDDNLDDDYFDYDSLFGDDDDNADDQDDPSQPIQFEQYITPYLICLGNLVYQFKFNKQCIVHYKLYEMVLTFWKEVEATDNDTLNNLLNELNVIEMSIYDEEETDEKSNKSAKGAKKPARNELVHNKDRAEIEKKQAEYKRMIDKLSVNLVKNLKLSLIEFVAKLIFKNKPFKKRYIHSYDLNTHVRGHANREADWWSILTNIFINIQINSLDSSQVTDKDIQFEALKFVRIISEHDRLMQNRLINVNNPASSMLINNFRNLLRKSSSIRIKTAAMLTVWTLSGDKNIQESIDRKFALYKAIGAQKFVDILFDCNDDLGLICLEALYCIATGPTSRDIITNELIKGQEELYKYHAIQALMRLLKSDNSSIKFGILKTISAACVTTCYITNYRNQLACTKASDMKSIVDLARNRSMRLRLRCEAYLTLSMICFSNASIYEQLTESYYPDVSLLIEELVEFFGTDERVFMRNIEDQYLKCLNDNDERQNYSSLKSYENENEEHNEYEFDPNSGGALKKEMPNEDESKEADDDVVIGGAGHENGKAEEKVLDPRDYEIIMIKLTAGLALCGFCYKNEVFVKKLLTTMGKLKWRVFKSIIEKLNRELERAIVQNDQHSYFEIQKARCLFGFQIAALHSFIGADEDPRAAGIKLMLDIIDDTKNALLRSIIFDYIGRSIQFNESMLEAFMCMNTVEILCKSLIDMDSENERERELTSGSSMYERGNAATTLNLFISKNPEARRRVLKMARKYPEIVDNLNYTNESLNEHFLADWGHFKSLEGSSPFNKKSQLNDRASTARYTTQSKRTSALSRNIFIS